MAPKTQNITQYPSFYLVEDLDYDSMLSLETIVFTQEEARHCVNVTIEDDSAVEYDEVIHLVLNTTEERVILDPEMANIIIVDNDSKHTPL